MKGTGLCAGREGLRGCLFVAFGACSSVYVGLIFVCHGGACEGVAPGANNGSSQWDASRPQILKDSETFLFWRNTHLA